MPEIYSPLLDSLPQLDIDLRARYNRVQAGNQISGKNSKLLVDEFSDLLVVIAGVRGTLLGVRHEDPFTPEDFFTRQPQVSRTIRNFKLARDAKQDEVVAQHGAQLIEAKKAHISAILDQVEGLGLSASAPNARDSGA